MKRHYRFSHQFESVLFTGFEKLYQFFNAKYNQVNRLMKSGQPPPNVRNVCQLFWHHVTSLSMLCHREWILLDGMGVVCEERSRHGVMDAARSDLPACSPTWTYIFGYACILSQSIIYIWLRYNILLVDTLYVCIISSMVIRFCVNLIFCPTHRDSLARVVTSDFGHIKQKQHRMCDFHNNG